jgi:CxxC-x17-CxxC domain-containing protein
MPFQDKNITCVDCGKPFVWTAGEQEFYSQKGFTNEPKRCKPCKAMKKAGGGTGGSYGGTGGYGSAGGAREEHQVTCSSCGQPTTVPFKPILDKPVYCKSCYQARRSSMTREPRF